MWRAIAWRIGDIGSRRPGASSSTVAAMGCPPLIQPQAPRSRRAPGPPRPGTGTRCGAQAPAQPVGARPPVPGRRPERPSCVPVRRSRFPGPGTSRRGACRRSSVPPASGNGTGPSHRWRPPVPARFSPPAAGRRPPATPSPAGTGPPSLHGARRGVPHRALPQRRSRPAACPPQRWSRASPGCAPAGRSPARGSRHRPCRWSRRIPARRPRPSRRAACATRGSSPRRPRPPSGASGSDQSPPAASSAATPVRPGLLRDAPLADQ